MTADKPPTILDPERAALSLPPSDARRSMATQLLAAHPPRSTAKGLPLDWRQVLVVAALSGSTSHNALARAFGVNTSTIKRWTAKKREFAEARAAACEGLRLLLVDPLVSEALRRTPESITDPKERQANIDLRLKLLAKLFPSEFGGTSLVQVNNINNQNNEPPQRPQAVRPLSLRDYMRALEQRTRLLEHDQQGSPS